MYDFSSDTLQIHNKVSVSLVCVLMQFYWDPGKVSVVLFDALTKLGLSLGPGR